MPEAPRFLAYFERAEGRPVLHMPRDQWNAMNVSSTGTVLLNLAALPMGGVASKASVVATYGARYSSVTAEVGIIRLDPADAPNIYNTDKYVVWEDLPSHQSFAGIVRAASTEDNQNLRDYLRANVLLVKHEPDREHHRPDLPGTVKVLLNRRST